MTRALPAVEPPRLSEFDLFRAGAIVLVVLSHSIVNRDQFPILFANLIAGASCLFVFISGFFFSEVFLNRFSYAGFLRKKFGALGIPFICVSVLGLAIDATSKWLRLDNAWPAIQSTLERALSEGYVLHPHWYIPFILSLFTLAPLHAGFARARLSTQLFFLALSVLAGVLAHRPPPHCSLLQRVPHAICYFTPFYLLGILSSRRRALWLTYQRPLLAFGTLLFLPALLWQTYVLQHPGNRTKTLLSFGGIDFILVQKLGACVLLLALCRTLTRNDAWPRLRILADASFAIFFLHSLACDELVRRASAVGTSSEWTLVATLGITLCGTLLSLAAAGLLRHLTPKSRAILGW